MGESRNADRVLVGRPEGKRSLGTPRRRWEDNIKMNLREVGYDQREWINLAQDRDRCGLMSHLTREYADGGRPHSGMIKRTFELLKPRSGSNKVVNADTRTDITTMHKKPHNEVKMGWSCSKAATRQMGARNHHVGPLHRKEDTRQAKKKQQLGGNWSTIARNRNEWRQIECIASGKGHLKDVILKNDYKTGKKSEGSVWEVKRTKSATRFSCNIGRGYVNEAARRYNIPSATLKRYNKRKDAKIRQPGHPLDLSQEVENDLVTHLLQLEKMFYGLTQRSVMQLAYEIAEKNKLATRFNKETKSAGKEWFSGFMKRHPELRLRQPEATSLARASGFNRVVVGKFFDTLEQLVDQHKLTAVRIFNMDETSHTVVQRQEKILEQRGKHQEKIMESLTFGAPPNTIFRCQDKGWMDSDTFCEWIRHFIRTVKPSPEEKVLLILDGHSSLTQSLKAIEICRQYGVIMLSLPSHCTHRLQPLHVSFFKPLNTFMSAAISTKMRALPGQQLNVQHIASLVGVAFHRAANMQITMNGFRHTGLWPSPSVSRAAEVEGATTAASAEKKMGDNVELLSGLTEYVSVKEISPLTSSSKSGQRKSGTRYNASGVVLTATPHKNALQQQSDGKAAKKRKLFDSKVKVTSKTRCVICGESENKDWIQCNRCGKWAHEECATITNELFYYC
ncbi:hypothetical protein ANN_15940 [Periplaneta americana]|uniref:HTH CENPB-type domain-containing protein n=1 Tax=Periplaneta americana TaxID=6978 RepID=A0ABQ8SHL3_PERAM|nr:hypothetical protein ANN_15940 [Periplaneta americana]